MMRFIVKCPDGEIRHTSTFTARDSAAEWADWGHICVRADDHQIVQAEECPNCAGMGSHMTYGDAGLVQHRETCGTCHGRGAVTA